MGIERREFEPAYEKPGRIVAYRMREDVESDPRYDQQIVIEPGKGGGNHFHPRTEWFSGNDSLEVVWQDENGKKHNERLGFGIRIKIEPLTPHAVVNRGQSPAILTEWANGPLENVTEIAVVEFAS